MDGSDPVSSPHLLARLSETRKQLLARTRWHRRYARMRAALLPAARVLRPLPAFIYALSRCKKKAMAVASRSGFSTG